MYYHCRDLKFVEYGKVEPPPKEEVDPFILPCYQWLGKYCGYCPQIWLSRSTSGITGFRGTQWGNKGKDINKNSVLFGFDIIKGFHVHYDMWESIMSVLMNATQYDDIEKELKRYFNDLCRYVKDDDGHGWWQNFKTEWLKKSDVDHILRKCLFVEHDQLVVPSLNLKSAKKVICRNEKQKKKLRAMGFINDRIQIMNVRKRPI